MVLLASDYDQTRFLKAQDLSSDKKLKIKSVTVESVGVGKDKEDKLTVWFTNDKRGLVLNRTNNRTIRGAYGDDTAGWVGKIVIVYPTIAEFRGDLKPALRVRIPPPKDGKSAAVTQLSPPPPAPKPEQVIDDDLDDDVDDL
jgi:hypothetical protein